jgi:small subunit ribosomal protein S8
MSMTDPVADFLTRLRNGQLARKKQVIAPSSKLKEAIAAVLKDEGYIADYHVNSQPGNKKVLTVALKYFQGKPVIERIERVSKPALRIYKGKDELPKVIGGLGIAIISTPAGVVSDRKARAAGQGGEVLCIVS